MISDKLINNIIKEEINLYSNKVKLITDYLNSHFIKADYDTIDKSGEIVNKPLVILLNNKRQPTDFHITLQDLFYRIQYKFQHILSNSSERDKFIKQIILDWYQNKISSNYNLSKY